MLCKRSYWAWVSVRRNLVASEGDNPCRTDNGTPFIILLLSGREQLCNCRKHISNSVFICLFLANIIIIFISPKFYTHTLMVHYIIRKESINVSSKINFFKKTRTFTLHFLPAWSYGVLGAGCTPTMTVDLLSSKFFGRKRVSHFGPPGLGEKVLLIGYRGIEYSGYR